MHKEKKISRSILLHCKKSGEQLQEAVEEREIDRLVYDLYGLSDDEIAIVEGTN
ncbi:MAG: BREX-1 system adenine-specific DNA-methyltransferase PglX [Bacteroidales bacterium]|nr:BREX-1 system adenine-specific DNA-methyltransferase PglX [Bacteroidales bacterium]